MHGAAAVLLSILAGSTCGCGPTPHPQAPSVDPTETRPTQQVYVTVDADDPGVTLMRAVEGLEHGQPVCRAPCNRYVEAQKGERFYFAGPGLQPSWGFQLYEPDDAIAWLEADATHVVADDVLLGLSLGTIMAGGAAALVGMIVTPSVDNPQVQEATSALGATGVGLTLVVGLGLQLGRMGTETTSYQFLDPMLHPTLREEDLPPAPSAEPPADRQPR